MTGPVQGCLGMNLIIEDLLKLVKKWLQKLGVMAPQIFGFLIGIAFLAALLTAGLQSGSEYLNWSIPDWLISTSAVIISFIFIGVLRFLDIRSKKQVSELTESCRQNASG